MEQSDLAQTVIFYFAVSFVLLYYLSPAMMLYTYYNTNILKWQELPIAQSFAVIFNCLYWVITGSQSTGSTKSDTIIWNGIGLGLGVLSSIVIWFAGGKFQKRFLFLFMSFNVIFQISWEISKIDKNNTNNNNKEGLISSLIASIFNVLMYLFCMQNIFTAWAKRNYHKLPIVSIVSGIASSFFWMIYGILVEDLYIIIPNGIGLGLLMASFCIWLWFYNTNTMTEEDISFCSQKSSVEIASSSETSINEQLLE